MHNPSASGKLEFLDGIRGLMAFNVILCHFVCVYYPQMYYPEYAESMGGFLGLFATTPLSALINGNIAVQYFFVLTGFLVGRSFFTRSLSARVIPDRSIKRYFRLLPIVFAATVFTFLTMRLGLQYHLKISDMVHNTYFLKDYCNFVERLISLPQNIFVFPFFSEGSSYVGPFWTIRYEFWGYIFTMVLCVIFREQHYRYPQYFLVTAILLKEWQVNYVPFLMGVFVADLQFNDAPAFLKKPGADIRRNKAARFAMVMLGLYFAACPMYFTGIHSCLKLTPYISTGLIRAFGISLLLFVLLDAPKAQKCFSHPLLLWIGDRSFEVYAFHWPLMLSLQAWIFFRLADRCSYDVAAVTAFLLTLPVIYLTAHLVHWLQEKWNSLTARYKSKL